MSRIVYDTHEVAAMIGRHVNDVLRLIHDRRLEARRMSIRGRKGKGRWVVTARELDRFIQDLPTADAPKLRKVKPRKIGAGELIEIC